MRVLLTGHQGYLGTVMAPMLAAAGPRRHRPRHRAVRRVRPRRPRRPPTRRASPSTCATSPSTSSPASTPCAPRGAVQRPARLARAGDHLRHQPPRLHPAGPAGQGGRASGASSTPRTCSVYGAAGGDELVDEDAPLHPVTPVRRCPRSGSRTTCIALADADFVPVSMRNATAFGFSPRLRADIVLNNLVGHAVLTGVVKVLSDGTPWRPLVHAATSPAPFARRARPRPQTPCTTRRSTWATERNNVHGRRDRRRPWWTPSRPPSSRSPARPATTRAPTASTSPAPARSSGFEAGWTIPDGAVQLTKEYRERDLTREQFEQRFTRLAVLAARQKAGELDETMRVRPKD